MSEIVINLNNIFKKDVSLYKQQIPQWIKDNSLQIFQKIFELPEGERIVYENIVSQIDKMKPQSEGKIEIVKYLTKYLAGHKGLVDLKFVTIDGQELMEVVSKNSIKYMIDKKEYPRDMVNLLFVRNKRKSWKDVKITNKAYPKK